MKASAVERVHDWRQQRSEYVNQIKQKIEQSTKKDYDVLSYFTFSLNMDEEGGEHLALCSYLIMNMGSQPITGPYICFKFSDEHPFEFFGKYVNSDSNGNNEVRRQAQGEWERIHHSELKNEIWLKPSHEVTIQPGEQLSFPNFQLKWQGDLPYQATMLGFTYSDQKPSGTPAINQFNITGGKAKKEEQHD
ncbi:hypothetical protein [Alkalibacillus haloalkaliphilus]|uniref:Uncharacterized protein n=1 Tax=Alkalibacillus haloalkaliphilus TaxID=94136 RepID=A0A511W387_9BACI|nr:hypothetical protein [Alkalibacillus haloalkaliphilus]GEN45544.1 hypothetical protein AHA02nite_13200 [Alkalibacillus haloalkaliphilus]